MAGVDDFLKNATPRIVGLCAGLMGQYLKVTAPVQGALIGNSGNTTTPTAPPASANSGIVLAPSPEYIAKVNMNSTGKWYDREGYVIDKNSYSQFSTLNGQAQIEWAESMGFSQDRNAYYYLTDSTFLAKIRLYPER